MSDVLSITVPIGSRYASVNGVGANGHRAGKKSPEYHRLFDDVKTAAETEMKWIGWDKAECECFRDDRSLRSKTGSRHDAMNLGKCEWDALTEAGVWLRTMPVRRTPYMPMDSLQCAGMHRVTIVVVKLYQSVPGPVEPSGAATAQHSGAPTSRASRGSAQAGFAPNLQCCAHLIPIGTHCEICCWKPGDPIPDGHALLNGKLVTRDLALEKAGIK